MDTDNVKKILTSKLSKDDVNLDGFVNISLVGKERLLPTNDINKIVDATKVFNDERQKSPYYRVIGTISPVISNCLFNLTDSANNNNNTLSVFNNTIFLDKSYPANSLVTDPIDITYDKSLQSNLKEKDGWFGYFDPTVQNRSLCKFIDMEPKRERFGFTPDVTQPSPVKNWELTITYPSTSETGHTLVKNGLLLLDINNALVSEKNMTAFSTPVRHNLSTGDIVRMYNTTGFNGEYSVVRVGLDNGDLKDYYFVLDITGGTLTQNSAFKKVINDVESQYYFRKFTKIKTRENTIIEQDDYEVYPAAFSENFFNDTNYQFVFNEDIDISNLTDNLGRPLSELFLTIIKTDGNNFFTPVKSGLEVPYIPKLTTSDSPSLRYLKQIPVINLIHNGPTTTTTQGVVGSHTPLESSVTINTLSFYGDVVEYNTETLNEVVLSEVMHRFNTNNRDLNQNTFTYIDSKTFTTQGAVSVSQTTINMGPRYEGYYYKPHHRIEIRQFSDYIEQADPNVFDIPTYSVLENGKYKWRDLVDIGFDQGTSPRLDYPFLNNAHYSYGNYIFWLKRQDPYGLWGLIYTDYPSDVLGDRITNKFKVNESDNVC